MKNTIKYLTAIILILTINSSLVHSCLSKFDVSEDPRTIAFNKIHKHIQMYFDHMDDTIDQIKQLEDALEETKLNSTRLIELSKVTFTNYRAHSDAFFDSIQYNIDYKKADEILFFFLQKRLEGIYTYNKHKYKDGHDTASLGKIFLEVSVNEYQVLNVILSELYSCIDLEIMPLHPETKKFIRMSPSLWPYLQSTNSDYDESPEEGISSKNGFSDLSYYLYHVKNEHITGRIPEELPTPPFWQKSSSKMSSLASAAITVKEKISTEEKSTIIRKKKKSKKRKGVKKKTLNSNVSSPTLDAADTDIDEDDTSVADDEVDLGISAELLLTASSDIAAAAKVPLTISKSVNSFEKAQVQISEQSQTFEASGDENEFIEQDEYDPKLEHQRCQSLKCLKKATESTTKKKESISAAPLTVRGVHLKTLRDIFDEKFHQISYAQFKSLWENLGGVIPDPENGGSHRSLYWNGRIVGRTYKPHGGHDYGYRCIKYLRIALEEIITDFISLTDERA